MSELIEQARKDRAAAEAAGDLGLVLFIDGFIAGAVEMREHCSREALKMFGFDPDDDDWELNGTE